jgi:hypothetical protein
MRPMDCWVKGGPSATRYHQAEYDERTGKATLRCSGKVVDVHPEQVMDYRWQPPWERHCYHPPCRAEVDP